MVKFKAEILRFEKNGEKTGWAYIEIPAHVAEKINPGVRQTYRVRGSIDHFQIELIALLPMGEGNFILPYNGTLRKETGKGEGDTVMLQLMKDDRQLEADAEFMDCLSYDPVALEFFNNLPRGHQNYFTKWIQSAKTEETRTRRITQSVTALSSGMGYGEMIRAGKKKV